MLRLLGVEIFEGGPLDISKPDAHVSRRNRVYKSLPSASEDLWSAQSSAPLLPSHLETPADRCVLRTHEKILLGISLILLLLLLLPPAPSPRPILA